MEVSATAVADGAGPQGSCSLCSSPSAHHQAVRPRQEKCPQPVPMVTEQAKSALGPPPAASEQPLSKKHPPCSLPHAGLRNLPHHAQAAGPTHGAPIPQYSIRAAFSGPGRGHQYHRISFGAGPDWRSKTCPVDFSHRFVIQDKS